MFMQVNVIPRSDWALRPTPCAKSVPAGLAHPVDRHLSGSHRPSWGPYWTATTNAAPNVRRPGAGTAPKPAKPPTTASPPPDSTMLTANATRGMDSNYERAERLKAPKPETFLCYRSCGRLDLIDAQRVYRQKINAPHRNHAESTTFLLSESTTASEGLSPYHIAPRSLPCVSLSASHAGRAPRHNGRR
jgi:hypothetical protein